MVIGGSWSISAIFSIILINFTLNRHSMESQIVQLLFRRESVILFVLLWKVHSMEDPTKPKKSRKLSEEIVCRLTHSLVQQDSQSVLYKGCYNDENFSISCHKCNRTDNHMDKLYDCILISSLWFSCILSIVCNAKYHEKLVTGYRCIRQNAP